MQNTRDDLQQGTFAGAVFPYDAECLATLDFEADVIKRREIVVEGNTIQAEQFLEAGAGGRVDRIVLRNTTELDDRLRH